MSHSNIISKGSPNSSWKERINVKFNFLGSQSVPVQWRENRASQYLETVSIDLNIVPQPFSPPAPPTLVKLNPGGFQIHPTRYLFRFLPQPYLPQPALGLMIIAVRVKYSTIYISKYDHFWLRQGLKESQSLLVWLKCTLSSISQNSEHIS